MGSGSFSLAELLDLQMKPGDSFFFNSKYLTESFFSTLSNSSRNFFPFFVLNVKLLCISMEKFIRQHYVNGVKKKKAR